MQAMAEGQAEVQTVQAEEHEQPGPYPIEKLQVHSKQKSIALCALCSPELAERSVCPQELGVAASEH